MTETTIVILCLILIAASLAMLVIVLVFIWLTADRISQMLEIAYTPIVTTREIMPEPVTQDEIDAANEWADRQDNIRPFGAPPVRPAS